MKRTIKFLSALLLGVAFVLFASPMIALAWDAPIHTVQLSLGVMAFLMGFSHVNGAFLTGPDISGISDGFFIVANQILRKMVNQWLIGAEATKYLNVNNPIKLPKLSAKGNPRPYREQDDFTDGAQFTDRELVVRQSKWDWNFNPENLRNTYLAEVASGNVDALKTTFYAWISEQLAREYLSQVLLGTVWLGDYDAAGSTVADIATGWGTLIADLITSSDLDPVVTGAITNSNAVASVEAVAESIPSSWRESGQLIPIICSYGTLDKYKKNYRTSYGFNFDKNEKGQYALDGLNSVLTPRAYLGDSQRLIAAYPGVFAYGTDANMLSVFPTPYLDYIKVRVKMPIGFEITDLEKLIVNDQA